MHSFRIPIRLPMKTFVFFLLMAPTVMAQQLTELTVEKIMRDPKWIGVAPSGIFWSEDGKRLYFNWNPDKNLGDSLYSISLTNRIPQKVSPAVRRSLPSIDGDYNKLHTKKTYNKNGDIFLLDIASGKISSITQTTEYEHDPKFSLDEKKIIFRSGINLFTWEIATGTFSQLTDFRNGKNKSEPKLNEHEKWLKADQMIYMEVLKQRADKKTAADKIQKQDMAYRHTGKRPKEIYLDENDVDQISISPDQKFITYRLNKRPSGTKSTIVPNYVTESGFTEDIAARRKVGVQQDTYELFVYHIEKDTVLQVKTDALPQIFDIPDYKKNYPDKVSTKGEDKSEKDKKLEGREVNFSELSWSDDGKNNVLAIRSHDNKNRWIVSLDLATQKLSVIDNQHDSAWIGGPGVSSNNIGWLADNATLWFQSEESGYSHLYTYNIRTEKKQALTSGQYEVQSAELSVDKKYFYLTTNEQHPGEKHFYKLPVTGGKAEKLTTLTGANEVSLSRNEKYLAIRYSYSNKPWELYLQEKNGKPQVVTSSLSEEFKSYAWRDPEVLTIKARDGSLIYSRLYRPAKSNGAAVIFVHGSGYLQNAHKWWSSYFREYMFHNLLAEKGYTVLDMDYRASAGYGRDWRTGIYRFMGGKDLTDNVDGASWLVEKCNIDPKRIGIYGGSYGGFITLMAMFTTPDVFAAGAALRPVTDWAHYNHPYTANILNEPVGDSLAYAKSSPLYYAKGLKGHLLICHGMVDVNVHFQDAVLLTQRLIELGKDNWEMAAYPVEDHGFVEPSSWTDEYKRILKLFERNLKE